MLKRVTVHAAPMRDLRWNERELAQLGEACPCSKEGLLRKRGPGRGQGYKDRWFRLCGNLLFYFKIDDQRSWKGNDPAGLIVVEGFTVQDESVPHLTNCFQLTFTGGGKEDGSRNYHLMAANPVELEEWKEALNEASYEHSRRNLRRLQQKLLLLSGTDPLSNTELNPELRLEMQRRSERAGAVSTIRRNDYQPKASKSPDFSQLSRQFRPSVKEKVFGKAKRSNSKGEVPSVDICLSCSGLPQLDESKLPSTFVEVSLRQAPPDTTPWITHAETEVIEGSASPSFFTVVAIPKDPAIVLEIGFSVFSVQSSPADDEVVISKLGKAQCSVDDILIAGTHKVTLPIRFDSTSDLAAFSSSTASVSAQLLQADEDDRRASVVTKHSHGIPTRQRASQLVRQQPLLSVRLKPFFSNLYQSRFIFPSKSGVLLKVAEELGESVFANSIPVGVLRMVMAEDELRIKQLSDLGDLSEQWQELQQRLLCALFRCMGEHQQALSSLQSLNNVFFKSSQLKKDRRTEYMPTNLHVQRLKVLAEETHGSAVSTYSFITFGAPAAHARGFRQGGLQRLLADSACFPTFLNKAETPAANARLIISRVATIRSNMAAFVRLLFRAAANLDTGNFSKALSDISGQVQQAMSLCQNDPSSAAVQMMKESRRNRDTDEDVSTDYTQSALDWAWDGNHFVPLRSWSMDSHLAAIQQHLVMVIQAANIVQEDIFTLLTRRRHQQSEPLTRSSSVAFASGSKLQRTPSIRTPVFCWTNKLVPEVSRLSQSLESLLSIILNSMQFYLFQMDALMPDIDQVLIRYDVVLAQVLAALTTVFYASLWSNISNADFLHQLESIGYLAMFESLLSTQGDEKGMLEDMCVAVKQLNRVSFKLVHVNNGELGKVAVSGSRHELTVKLPVQGALFSILPLSLRNGQPVSVRAVLVTLGINEAQTLSDLVTSNIQLQNSINQSSLVCLKSYVDDFCNDCKKRDVQVQVESQLLPGLVQRLEDALASQKSKNVDILHISEELCRRVRGGRLTSCKSGKDRTAMAVTYEECRLLLKEHKLREESFQQALDSLRSRGTRLHNCMKNIGLPQYAFNSLQLKCLPLQYCPPAGTYGKKISS